MAITVSKLLATSQSAAEQKQITECAQQLEEASKLLSVHLVQQMKEASNILMLKMTLILKEIGKECSASVAQQIAKSYEKFSAPAYIPAPLYLTHRPPQIIYVYIDDLPGLN